MGNKVLFRGFVGDAYKGRVQRFNASETINLYPEMNEASLSQAKLDQVAALVSVPGKTLCWDSTVQSEVRGLWQPSNTPNVLIAVIGSSVYRLTSSTAEDGTFNDVLLLSGQLNTTSGQVSISDNGIQVVIVDGQYGYYMTIGGTSINQITDGHFYPANTVDYLDGYFLFNRAGTAECFFSNINAITFPPLNTFRKNSSSDNVIGLKVNVGQIYLFGEKNTEVWYNSGASANTPFSRVGGKFIPFGCAAPLTIQTINGTVAWLGQTSNGSGVVYTLQNDVATRISTHAVEFSIQQAGADLSQAHAYTQQIDGHLFYCLQIPGLNKTWCFDMLRPAWHCRQSNIDGDIQQDRAANHAYFNGRHIVGDNTTGKLFALDFEVYTDGEYPLTRTRQAPHLANNLDRVFYHELEVDMMFGVGISEGYGANPVAILNISDDGGQTFGPDIPMSIGRMGDYMIRAQWWALGYSTDRVFRVSISDPVKVQILSATIDTTLGES